MLYNAYRVIRFLYYKIYNTLSNITTKVLLKINKTEFSTDLISNGIPKIYKHRTANFRIGKNFKMNNTIISNPIGRNEKCLFVIKENASLVIGQNVGMSGTTIVCRSNIKIGDNIKIGGNVCIYDTNFHSLSATQRNIPMMDRKYTISKKIEICDNVFIGAHATILKGIRIGENSIIGACSVVTRDVPDNEIWAGNPAKFIRKILES